MSNSRHKDDTNDLEVEITDLDPRYEGGRVVETWVFIGRLYGSVKSKYASSSIVGLAFLVLIFLLPLVGSSSLRDTEQTVVRNSHATECIKIHLEQGTTADKKSGWLVSLPYSIVSPPFENTSGRHSAVTTFIVCSFHSQPPLSALP